MLISITSRARSQAERDHKPSTQSTAAVAEFLSCGAFGVTAWGCMGISSFSADAFGPGQLVR